jgi:hypothetical protein
LVLIVMVGTSTTFGHEIPGASQKIREDKIIWFDGSSNTTLTSADGWPPLLGQCGMLVSGGKFWV